MKSKGLKVTLILLTLVAALFIALPACGEEEKDTTLIFSDLDWVSAQIQNGIARKILEDGYGYQTDAVFGGTVPLMEALTRGDTNITMEIWLPNQQEAFDSAIAAGTIEVIGNSLEDNWQSGFIIPNYVAEAHPGLKSPADLKNPEYMELFVTPDSKGKARLLNCIPGWSAKASTSRRLRPTGLATPLSR